jgi:thiol-disulfide isomerase/thioredoxin
VLGVGAQDSKHVYDLIKSKPKVVVDYVAPWCGKCKQVSRALGGPPRVPQRPPA